MLGRPSHGREARPLRGHACQDQKQDEFGPALCPQHAAQPDALGELLEDKQDSKDGATDGLQVPVRPSNSPLRARRMASIRSGAHEVRLARVRVRTLAPSRKDSRRRMAGGELRLGTAVIYMSVYITQLPKILKNKFLFT